MMITLLCAKPAFLEERGICYIIRSKKMYLTNDWVYYKVLLYHSENSILSVKSQNLDRYHLNFVYKKMNSLFFWNLMRTQTT